MELEKVDRIIFNLIRFLDYRTKSKNSFFYSFRIVILLQLNGVRFLPAARLTYFPLFFIYLGQPRNIDDCSVFYVCFQRCAIA